MSREVKAASLERRRQSVSQSMFRKAAFQMLRGWRASRVRTGHTVAGGHQAGPVGESVPEEGTSMGNWETRASAPP